MERKKKRLRLAALLLAAALALGLTGCESLKDNVANMLGFSSAEEVATPTGPEATTPPHMLPEAPDAPAQWPNVVATGTLSGVYTAIGTRTPAYSQVPGDSLPTTACGTAEGVQEYKIALWKKVDGGAQYVDGSTGYIHTDGSNYRFTIGGLDPAAQYRLTISYDSSRYYLYGMFKAEGIVG